MRRALTELAAAVFVDDFARQRLRESSGGLGFLGVEPERQTFWRFPDGQLAQRVSAITVAIVGQALLRRATVLISPGDYEAHPDHVAARQATELASALLALRHQRHLGTLVLSTEHTGVFSLPVDGQRKRELMSFYPTQFPGRQTAQGFEPNADFLAADFADYAPLFTRETYDFVPPSSCHRATLNPGYAQLETYSL